MNYLARMTIRKLCRRSILINYVYNPVSRLELNNQECSIVKSRCFCSVVANSACQEQSKFMDEITKALRHGNIYGERLNVDNALKVASYLVHEGAKPDEVLEALYTRPEVGNESWNCWKSMVDTLRGFGANISQIIRMVVHYPLVLNVNMNRLQLLFDAIQATGISSCDLVDRLVDNAEILTLNANEVKSRHEALKQMFTKNDISKMVRKNLRVLSVTTREIERKLQYIVHRMGLEQPQVVNSQAMLKSLQHIMERHEFLVRTGGYHTPNPKARNLSTNPQLKMIVDTDDHVFATNIAKVTLEEYHLFCRLAKERKNVLNKLMRTEDIDDIDEDDDDDDDDDD